LNEVDGATAQIVSALNTLDVLASAAGLAPTADERRIRKTGI
jgi:hypothetical protein